MYFGGGGGKGVAEEEVVLGGIYCSMVGCYILR
jgi:hypothetical protein